MNKNFVQLLIELFPKLLGALLLTLLVYHCTDNDIDFNKTGWNEHADAEPCPPLREAMLDDLLTNHTLKGLSTRQIVAKLGEPDNHKFTEPNVLRYEISAEYGWGDIVHVEALDFYFKENGVIHSWKVVKYDIDM